MTNLRKTLGGLPWIAKLLLVIFLDGLYGGLYRLTGKNTLSKIIGVILFGSFVLGILGISVIGGILGTIFGIIYGVCWIVDLITVILAKDITVFAD